MALTITKTEKYATGRLNVQIVQFTGDASTTTYTTSLSRIIAGVVQNHGADAGNVYLTKTDWDSGIATFSAAPAAQAYTLIVYGY